MSTISALKANNLIYPAVVELNNNKLYFVNKDFISQSESLLFNAK
jgi:hypothetical protein